MKPDQTLFTQLAVTPKRLSALFAALEPELHGVRPDGQLFAFTEHLWHLADLETEAFQVRLRRLQEEAHPLLHDFDGTAAARRRDYLALDPAEGLARFTRARVRTLEVFSRVPHEAWERRGEMQGVGELRLADLPCRILQHDHGHLGELRDLLNSLHREHLIPRLGEVPTVLEVCA